MQLAFALVSLDTEEYRRHGRVGKLESEIFRMLNPNCIGKHIFQGS
jgi:hypothetical protein